MYSIYNEEKPELIVRKCWEEHSQMDVIVIQIVDNSDGLVSIGNATCVCNSDPETITSEVICVFTEINSSRCSRVESFAV